MSAYLKIDKETPEKLLVRFWDESGFSLRATLRKNGGNNNSRKNVRKYRIKGRVNLRGGLRNLDNKMFIDFLAKGKSGNFINLYSNRKSFINRSRVRASSSFMRILAQNHQICVAWENQNFAAVW